MNNAEKRVLIADDEDTLREMLVTVFEDEGYLVDAAIDGDQAWSLINENNYQLLITDMFMPQLNGFELIQKCQQSFPSIKTILLSGGGRGIEAEHKGSLVNFEGKTLEIDAFLKKPCPLNDMLSTVEKLLT